MAVLRFGTERSAYHDSQRGTKKQLLAQSTVQILLALACGVGVTSLALVSSIFLTQVNIMEANGKPAQANISTVGWSSLALTLLLLLGGIMILTLFGFGFKRYPSSGMPIASVCSKAISAACHPMPGRYNEATEKLQYGVMGKLDDGSEVVGFSSTKVEPLVQGNHYS